jgi:N-methylhydantoinase A
LERKRTRFEIAGDAQEPVIGSREAIFAGQAHQTPILWRDWIETGAEFSGPLVIEEDSATTVVPPGYQVRLDEMGNIIISAEEL